MTILGKTEVNCLNNVPMSYVFSNFFKHKERDYKKNSSYIFMRNFSNTVISKKKTIDCFDSLKVFCRKVLSFWIKNIISFCKKDLGSFMALMYFWQNKQLNLMTQVSKLTVSINLNSLVKGLVWVFHQQL